MTHDADIGIRLDAAGPFAAMYDQLASARAIMQKFVAFMDEYYSIGGVIEPLRSDSKEDELLKETYAEMKQWMEDE